MNDEFAKRNNLSSFLIRNSFFPASLIILILILKAAKVTDSDFFLIIFFKAISRDEHTRQTQFIGFGEGLRVYTRLRVFPLSIPRSLRSFRYLDPSSGQHHLHLRGRKVTAEPDDLVVAPVLPSSRGRIPLFQCWHVPMLLVLAACSCVLWHVVVLGLAHRQSMVFGSVSLRILHFLIATPLYNYITVLYG